MEKDIQLGPEDMAFVKIEGGKLILGNKYVGKQLSAELSVAADLEEFGQMVKDAIPGKVDDMVVDAFIALLKAIS
jgi:hypothetical protein